MHRRHLQQQRAEAEARRLNRRRHRRGGAASRHLGRIGSFVAATLLLTLLALAAGHQRLRQGPVSLAPLAGLIADRLTASADGLRFSVGQAVFALGAPGEVSGLRLGAVRVTDADGFQIATVPELSMRFHLWDLARGRLAPTEIQASGLSAVIERDVEGRIRLPGAARAERAGEEAGAAGDPGRGGAVETPAELAAQASVSQADEVSALVALLAAQAPGEGPLGRLVRVRADDVDVRFRDNFTGQFWRLTDAEIEVTREADRDVGHLSGRVAPPPRAVGALADPGGEPERWAADDDPYAAAPALPVTLDPPDPGGPPPSTEAPRMARFSVEGERAHGDGEIGVRVRLGGLPIAHLALAAGAPESEAATFGDLRAGVRGEARLAGDGRLLSFRGGARVGRGTLVGVPEPFGRIERVVLGLDMDAARPGRVDVRLLRLLGGAGRLEATGEISRWPSGEGLSLALDIDEVEVRPEAGFSEAQIYDDGRLTAHFLPRAGRIELETLQLESAGATLSAQGAAQWDAAGPEVAIGFATGPMSLDALLAGWPLEAGPGARRWVAAHLSEQPVAAPGEDGDPAPIPTSADAAGAAPAAAEAGTAPARPGVAAARGAFWAAPGEAPELTLDFAFQGLRGVILPGMPSIENAAGRGRVGLDRVDIALSHGSVTPPGGRPIDLSGSSFSSPDIDAEIPHGMPVIRAEGRVSDVLSLLDQPPLMLTRKFAMDLSGVTGRSQTLARLSFPLIADLELEQLQVSAAAGLSDVAVPLPGGGGEVQARALDLDVDGEGLRLAGAARIDGIPAEVEWRERFSGGSAAAPRRAVTARATLDAASVAKLGVTGLDFEGTAPLSVSLDADGQDDPDRFSISADLTPAALAIPALGWAKPAGTAGRLSVSGRIGPDGAVTAEALSGEAAGLGFVGAARIDADGELRRLKLDRVTLDDVLDVGLEVKGKRAGRLEAAVEGAFVDFGEFWRRAEAGAATDADADAGTVADEEAGAPEPGGPGAQARAPDARRPFDVTLKVAQAKLVEGIELTAVDGAVTREDGVTRAVLSAEVNGGQRARVGYRIGRRGGGRLSIDSPDAGALIRDLGLSDDVSGGVLKLRGRLPPGSDALVGVAHADGIRVGGGEALSGVLTRAARDGLLARADPPTSGPALESGYVFDTVRAPFRLEGRKVTLTDALAAGPLLAVKLSGDYDLSAETVDFEGVLTPAYAINGILNDLPLVGFLLGGEGEGLLALNFSVSGPAKNPEMSLNPFSILTPGILRDLFSGFESSGETAPPTRSGNSMNPGR